MLVVYTYRRQYSSSIPPVLTRPPAMFMARRINFWMPKSSTESFKLYRVILDVKIKLVKDTTISLWTWVHLDWELTSSPWRSRRDPLNIFVTGLVSTNGMSSNYIWMKWTAASVCVCVVSKQWFSLKDMHQYWKMETTSTTTTNDNRNGNTWKKYSTRSVPGR